MSFITLSHVRALWKKSTHELGKFGRYLKQKDIREYDDLGIDTDTILLALFEPFRKTSDKTYGLDPGNYLTSPGF